MRENDLITIVIACMFLSPILIMLFACAYCICLEIYREHKEFKNRGNK